eukprot:m.900846 g.900846  ORF g.900846 m.900846 type:complete len:80 (-) comp60050_c0_seq5:4637-4876(-)
MRGARVQKLLSTNAFIPERVSSGNSLKDRFDIRFRTQHEPKRNRAISMAHAQYPFRFFGRRIACFESEAHARAVQSHRH